MNSKLISAYITAILFMTVILAGCYSSGLNSVSTINYVEDKQVITMTVRNARVDYKNNPLGIENTTPCFSWELQSALRNKRQSAYRLIVASSIENLDTNVGDIWDSGKVSSDETVGIKYDGKDISDETRYYWKVKVWDESDSEEPWSDRAFFETGLMGNKNWKAKWIVADNEENSKKAAKIKDNLLKTNFSNISQFKDMSAPFFRKEFNVQKEVLEARLYVTALGLYEAYINGTKVGKDYYNPGWTDYNKRVMYSTYDVTSMLINGENAIGAVLGNGWYSGATAWKAAGEIYDSTIPKFLCELHIKYSDGSYMNIVTDEGWKSYREGPIVFNDTIHGEYYDARKEVIDWNKRGLNDSSWNKVNVLSLSDSVKLVPFEGEPIQITRELSTQKVTKVGNGTYIFDLGQNMVGFSRLKVKGSPGKVIKLRYAEMLQKDGTLYTATLRSAKATDYYVLKGGNEEIYSQRFTYHGFRYIEVSGLDYEPKEDTIMGLVANSSQPETGNFESSNDMVNKLWSNIFWSQRGNYFSVPTDCPQRDERLGWAGDAQVFLRTASYNMDIMSFFNKWLVDVRDAQYEDGCISDVNPKGKDFSKGNSGWGDAAVIIPYTIYQVYGDKKILSENYDMMKRWVDYCKNTSVGYLRDSGDYGDWLSFDKNIPSRLVGTAYFAYSTKLLAKTARVLNKLEEEAEYNRQFESIRLAFQNQYLHEHMLKYNTLFGLKECSQTAYLLSLAFDLIPQEQKALFSNNLARKILEVNGGQLTTGFLGVSLINPVLTDNGYSNLAYKLLFNENLPSWGYEVKNGATTIWERWNSYSKESGFGDSSMNSFNHYAYGSIGEWLYRYVLGIDLDPETPGFKSFLIKPVMDYRLTNAKGSYHSVRGKIFSEWSVKDKKFNFKISIPANTTATVYVPATSKENIKESGKDIINVEDIRFIRQEENYSVFQIPSGDYILESIVP